MAIGINKIYHGDSFELINDIPDNSVDLILEDMPYNTTACEWECEIDLQKYWESRIRIIKNRGVIVLTGSQPFSSRLIVSNLQMFKFEMIWEKDQGAGFVNANNMPLKKHENIMIFSMGSIANGSKTKMSYYPQGLKLRQKTRRVDKKDDTFLGARRNQYNKIYIQKYQNYPHSVIYCKRDRGLHETQKPVELFGKLIKLFTKENDIVIDGFAGSGTTGVAAIKTNRNFICIEKDLAMFQKAEKRIKREQSILKLKLVA